MGNIDSYIEATAHLRNGAKEIEFDPVAINGYRSDTNGFEDFAEELARNRSCKLLE